MDSVTTSDIKKALQTTFMVFGRQYAVQYGLAFVEAGLISRSYVFQLINKYEEAERNRVN